MQTRGLVYMSFKKLSRPKFRHQHAFCFVLSMSLFLNKSEEKERTAVLSVGASMLSYLTP